MTPREHTFVASGNPKRGMCRTPHEEPRAAEVRGVCRTCANEFYRMIAADETTDERLVEDGLWLPDKRYSVAQYVRDKQNA